MLRTKCCKEAQGTPIVWQSPKYGQMLEIRFCYTHWREFEQVVQRYQQGGNSLEQASDRALEVVKPDQSRVARRAGITG